MGVIKLESGKVIIGTELDTKSFDAQIKKVEKRKGEKSHTLAKSVKSLNLELSI